VPLLVDRERSLVKRLGVGVAPLGIVEQRELVEAGCQILMGGTEGLFRNLNRLPSYGNRLGVFLLLVELLYLVV
jgi:hypothetical protein